MRDYAIFRKAPREACSLEEHSVAERSFLLLDRVKMLIKPMAQPLLRNSW